MSKYRDSQYRQNGVAVAKHRKNGFVSRDVKDSGNVGNVLCIPCGDPVFLSP